MSLSLLMLAYCHTSLSIAYASELSLKDGRGQTVTFNTVPKRIVSVSPALTESVCTLGYCQSLVGVDAYSNWPAQVSQFPKVGRGLDPNIEAIVRLKPDLVLMATSTRGASTLEKLGLKVFAIEPKTHTDVKHTLSTLSQILGVPAQSANNAWDLIYSDLRATAQTMPKSAKPIRIYYEVDSGPYGAGETSFIGETFKQLGLSNVLPASLGVFPKVNPEYIVQTQPDIIMVSQRNYAELVKRPGWDKLKAIKNHKVCTFSSEQADAMVRAGPRMAQAAKLIANCVQSKFSQH